MKIFYKTDEGESLITVRFEASLKGVRADNLYSMLFDISNRMEWDEDIKSIDLLHKKSGHEDIIVEEVNMPFPLTNREYVKWRYYVSNKDNPGLVRQHGLYDISSPYYAVTMKSINVYELPEKENVVRGEIKKSYWFIREDPHDKNSCKIKVVVSQDLKGMIPQFILNRLAAKYPKKMLNNFLDSYKQIFL